MRDMMIERNEMDRTTMTPAVAGFVSQFYIFLGETYLGWDCFDSSSVKVGGSAFADLVLDDPDLDDIQAEFIIHNGRIRVVNLGRPGGLTVNNRDVSESAVGSFDVVKIGRYTVKAKLKKMTAMNTDEPIIPKLAPMDTVTVPAMAKKAAETVPTASVSKPLKVQQEKAKPEIKEEPQPAIVRNLLTLMDQYDDLDFDSIEELLTHQTGVKPEEKTEKPQSVTAAANVASRSRDEVTDRFRPAVQPVIQKPEEPVRMNEPGETVKRPSPYGLVSETKPETPVVQPQTLEDEQPLDVKPSEKECQDQRPEPDKRKVEVEAAKPSKKELNSFPSGFFASAVDDEDEDEDDCEARFRLRDILSKNDGASKDKTAGDNVLQIIKFKGGNLVSIAHLKNETDHMMVDGKETFCRVHHSETQGTRIYFTEKLLGTINKAGDKELKADMGSKPKGLGSGSSVYTSLLPVRGELNLSDGYYDYVIRKSVLAPDPVTLDPAAPVVPLHQKVLKSQAFKYGSRAFIFHLIFLIVFSYSVKLPDKSEFKNPETFFVKVDTEDIKKPVKPLPKPKPVLPSPVINPEKTVKQELAKKEEPKETLKTAAREQSSPKVETRSSEPADTGSGKAGNVVNKNVNQVGLLAALGKKTGISIAPNEALASVTNMDAVTSRRGNEANVKLGGIVGSLGDSKIAISSGGVINNKGGAGVYRSAGIGGKGSVAAMESGKAGKRAVKAVVAAPVAKKVRASGGGISREAVAKVINDHMDEINGCYESALVSDPSLMGRVEFEWTILQSGGVGDVKIKSSTVKSSQIHACIISAIKGWKFPQPQGADVIVSYPFVFDVTGF